MYVLLWSRDTEKWGNKSYWNLLVFVSIDFFGTFKSWITINVIIWGKRNFWDFRVFNLGCRAKSTTRKSRKFLFFLLNHIGNFQFLAQFIKKLLDTLKLSDVIQVFEKLNHSNEPYGKHPAFYYYYLLKTLFIVGT